MAHTWAADASVDDQCAVRPEHLYALHREMCRSQPIDDVGSFENLTDGPVSLVFTCTARFLFPLPVRSSSLMHY
jgi:hypothetical protein